MSKLNMCIVNEWAEWARKNSPEAKAAEAARLAQQAAQQAAEAQRRAQLAELKLWTQLVAEDCDQQITRVRVERTGQPVPLVVQPADPTVEQLTSPELVVLPRRALKPKWQPRASGQFDWPAHKRAMELAAQRETEAREKRTAAARESAERRRKRQRADKTAAVLSVKLGNAKPAQYQAPKLGALLASHVRE